MIARNGLLSRGINFENVLRVLEGVGSRVHRLTGRARKSGTTTPVLPSTTTKIGCREILPTDLEAVINLLTTGFQRDRQYWVNAIHRLSEHTTPSGFPKYGYLLESDGVLVGVLLAIFTSRIEDGTISVRCNGSSLYVAPAFRAYVPLLIKRYERAKNVTYLNITPAPRTWAMVEAQGYKRFSNGLQIVLYFQWLSIRHLPNVKIETINHHDERLPSFESDLLADHAGYGCMSLICEYEGKLYPFVFGLYKKFGVPLAYLIYCRDQQDFVSLNKSLGRFLMSHGYPIVVLDANGKIPGLFGKYIAVRPKYWRGVKPPRLGDLAYTERAMFGF